MSGEGRQASQGIAARPAGTAPVLLTTAAAAAVRRAQALGSYQKEWEMFTDGYTSQGER